MNIYLFDIDGTLTKPRQKIKEKHREILLDFLEDNDVYFVTGSDYEKIKEQLGGELLWKVKGVFTCMGNEYWQGGIRRFSQSMYVDPDLEEALEKEIKESKYPYETFSNKIEKRTGMINFSYLGRGLGLNTLSAQDEIYARNEYYNWDKENKQRQKLIKKLQKRFGRIYDFAIGGQISIDIFEKGMDKRQVLDYIADYSDSFVTFFGDKVREGGNDYSLAQRVMEERGSVKEIKDVEECFSFLEKL